MAVDSRNQLEEGPSAIRPHREKRSRRLRSVLGRFAPLAVLVALLGALGAFAPSFLSLYSLSVLAAESSVILLLAIGQTLVILLGGIDLSMAALASLASVLIADAPHRLLWGSNWPHPNLQPPPDDSALLAHFTSLVPDLTSRQRILVDNPAEL